MEGAAPVFRHRLADSVSVSAFDSNEGSMPTLVIVGKRRFALTGLSSQIVACLQEESMDVAALLRGLTERFNLACDEGLARDTLQRLQDKGIVCSDDALSLPAKTQAKTSYFAIRIPLVPASGVRLVAKQIEPILHPRAVAILLPFLLIFQTAVCWWYRAIPAGIMLKPPRGLELALVIVVGYVGLLLHEFGHAAACTRFGGQTGSIGVSIYLIFPAFYTDVSDAWRLNRGQRAVVDAAGIYVSLLAAFIAFVCFFICNLRACMLLSWAYTITAWFNLNPFIRADGYWLLSDALGISNLAEFNQRISKWLFTAARGKHPKAPYLLLQHRLLGRAYMVYYVLWACFWIITLFEMLRWYIPHLIRDYPIRVGMAVHEFTQTGFSGDSLQAILMVVLTSIPLIGIALYGWRFVRRRIAVSGRMAAKLISQKGAQIDGEQR